MPRQKIVRPEVVNCMGVECSHYCGRPSSYHKALGNPVDLSVLGNPFYKGSREDNIAAYRAWLWSNIKVKGSAQRLAIESIPTTGATLGCFCNPKPCHCSVIANAVMWLANRSSAKEWRDSRKPCKKP